MTPEQLAAYMRRRNERQTTEYHEDLERDVAAYEHEYPPRGSPPTFSAPCRHCVPPARPEAFP